MRRTPAVAAPAFVSSLASSIHIFVPSLNILNLPINSFVLHSLKYTVSMYSRSRPIHPCLKTLTESKSYEVKSICVIYSM